MCTVCASRKKILIVRFSCYCFYGFCVLCLECAFYFIVLFFYLFFFLFSVRISHSLDAVFSLDVACFFLFKNLLFAGLFLLCWQLTFVGGVVVVVACLVLYSCCLFFMQLS